VARQVQVDEIRSATSPDDLQKKQEKEAVRKFLAEALARFHAAAEHEAKTRKESLDDWKFSMGEQWTADIRSQRVADGRPCLVMDHLQQSIRQITNEQRQQRPAIQINPAGDGATREVADVFQGMVRHIETQSEAEVAYDSAHEHMVRGGIGWLRVLTEYEPGLSFDQCIKIKHIRNPFTVYSDPAATEHDKSDAKWRFIIEDIPWEEYRRIYQKAENAKLEDFVSVGDTAAEWARKDAVRIAEYFHVEEETKKLYKLSTGKVVKAEDFKALNPSETEPSEIEDKRDYIEAKVVWTKMNAIEILEETEWPGSIIPVIPVLGDDFDIDGKWYLAGVVRNAKDPQRMYNYQCSAATELSALAPKAPFIGPKGSFKSSENQWKQVNRTNFPYLEYDIVNGPGGGPMPPPERNVAEPPIQAAVALMQAAGNDLKASIGIYDASLGAPGPEQSGKAILARQKQGSLATLNFSDNLARAIRVVGRIVVDLIPKIYTEPRIQRVINPDQTVKNVAITNSANDGYSPSDALPLLRVQDAAIATVFDIGVGRFDVTVSVGPSYQTKRQEAVQSVQALVEAYPPLMQVAGDLLVGNMDWPYAQEIAKRLKKQIPPNLIDEGDQSPEAKLTQAQQQITQLTQQVQQLTQLHDQAQQIIQGKTVENDAKVRIKQMEGKIDIMLALLDKEKALAVAEVSTKAQNSGMRQKLETDVYLATHGTAHELAMAKTAPPDTDSGSQSATSDNSGGSNGS
jgi:hypothetical protein